MTCFSCRAPLRDDAVRCPFCGADQSPAGFVRRADPGAQTRGQKGFVASAFLSTLFLAVSIFATVRIGEALAPAISSAEGYHLSLPILGKAFVHAARFATLIWPFIAALHLAIFLALLLVRTGRAARWARWAVVAAALLIALVGAFAYLEMLSAVSGQLSVVSGQLSADGAP
ncbi:MAG: hypothetical protein HY719_02980 [Planctomycetes bacterium]|nr:hypothetical protein [Planctomycetota bacterium]